MSARWFFNVSKWNPSSSDILLASSCVQAEEKERLARFVFKKDFKSSLIGRLLMRKFVHEATDVSYNAIEFKRDAKGKPYLIKPSGSKVSFNVSHQGDYAVLAGLTGASDGETKLGVDVMKLEYTGGKSLSEFFRIMTKNFAPTEWTAIKDCGTEKGQIAMFCRHWCLKESYVKATGVGITVNLQDIVFKINTSNLRRNVITFDTELYVKGLKQEWEFHETLIDDEHCVAVAFNSHNNDRIAFEELNFDSLMNRSVPLLDADEIYCENYFKKLDRA